MMTTPRLKPLSLRTVAGNAFTTTFSRLVAVTVQTTFFLLVARQAGPDSIGIFAIASTIALGLSMLSTSGLRQYSSIHHNDTHRLSDAHSSGLLFGSIAAFLGLVIAGGAVLATDSAAFSALLVGLCVPIPILALDHCLSGQLIGHGKLNLLAAATILADLASALAAGLAYFADWGIYTLVVLRISYSGFCLLALLISLWPVLFASFRPWNRELFRFSSTFTTTGIISWINDSVPIYILGATTGASLSGVYRMAARLSGSAGELTNEAVSRIAWSRFQAEHAHDSTAFDAATLGITSAVFLGLAAVSDPLVDLALGPDWHQASTLLVFFAIYRLLDIQFASVVPLLSSAGDFKTLILVALLPTVLAVTGIWLTASLGSSAVGCVLVIAGTTSFLLKLSIAYRKNYLHPKKMFYLSLRPLFASATMATLIILINASSLLNQMALAGRFLSLITMGVAIYITTIIALYPRRTRAAIIFISKSAS